MTDSYIKNVVEAALLAAGRPLQLNELAQLFDENTRPEQSALRTTLETLEADYSGRGIEVKETATGFRIQVRKEMANEVSRLWPERPPKYSRALLETLALIAYRQPITRAEIEAVRGVAVNPNIIKTVIERNWVRVVGTRDVPGRPELLGTTKEFLDYFGLRSLEDLPPLAELKAMGEINLQLDLAKPGDSGSEGGSNGGSGSDDGSGSSGAGGANGAGDVAVAEAHSGATEPADETAVGQVGEPVSLEEIELVEVVADAGEGAPAAEAATHLDVSAVAENVAAAEGADNVQDAEAVQEVEHADGTASAATESLTEVTPAHTAATTHDVAAEPAIASSNDAESDNAEPLVALSHEEHFVAYEHDPHAATITHVEVESDSGDVTVEVEALTFVEQQLEAEERERERAKDTSIETGEFEMSELGMTAQPATVIEAEFEADDISSAQGDEDDAADDEEELSAGPQSSTELVAAPRDRDD